MEGYSSPHGFLLGGIEIVMSEAVGNLLGGIEIVMRDTVFQMRVKLLFQVALFCFQRSHFLFKLGHVC